MIIIPAGTPHYFSEISESLVYTIVRIDPGGGTDAGPPLAQRRHLVDPSVFLIVSRMLGPSLRRGLPAILLPLACLGLGSCSGDELNFSQNRGFGPYFVANPRLTQEPAPSERALPRSLSTAPLASRWSRWPHGLLRRLHRKRSARRC